MTPSHSTIQANDIALIVYDFDGVLTDNRVLVLEDGKEAVFCNRSDGLAIGFIKTLDIPQIIISTETNPVVQARSKKLNIECIHGVKDKKTVLSDFCAEHQYPLEKVLYFGNDVNDLEAMQIVGFKAAPQDAAQQILDIADIMIPKNGGYGVIREFYEKFLIR